MIGEFCPKVFALKTHSTLRLESGVGKLGAEQSAQFVTRRVYRPLWTARIGRQPRCRIAYIIVSFLILKALVRRARKESPCYA